MRRATIMLWALLMAWLVGAAAAQDYPSRPVSLVVAFTPGGPSDVLARIVGRKLEQLLGAPFVILNRPGAGGNIAAEYVAHAQADGYTLLVGNNSILATNASLYKHLEFDPAKDFAPICLIGSQANILVVNPKLAVKSMGELIELARSKPGKLNYASSGYGAAAHLAAELFKARAHLELVHVPYKGAAPALQDLMGGQVDLMFATAASVTGPIQSQLVRPLAVTTLKRTKLLPDLPTVAELGLDGFEATTWHGLVAPVATAPAIIAKLNGATRAALADAEVSKALDKLGVDIEGGTAEQFASYIKAEIPKWSAVVKAAGAKLE